MKRAALTLLLSMLSVLPSWAQAARPEVPLSLLSAPVPVLTVSGEGETRVAPDEATVRLGVLAQAPSARVAQEEVNRVANAVLAAVRKLGVPAEQIQTSELNLNPVYAQSRGNEGEPHISGYQASNVVSILLRKLDQVGPVIDAGLGAGANRLDGVSFGLREDQGARAQALTEAVSAARSKAQALAQALKVRLVRILEVAEGGVQVSPQPLMKSRVMMQAGMAESTPVSAGQVGVNATVTVRWEIAPCPAQGSCE